MAWPHVWTTPPLVLSTLRLHVSDLHPPSLAATTFDNDSSLCCRLDSMCDDLTHVREEPGYACYAPRAATICVSPSCIEVLARHPHIIATCWQVANAFAHHSSVISKTPMSSPHRVSILGGR